MSLLARIALLFAAISLSTPAAMPARPPQSTSPEGQLFNSLNRERATQGLPVLRWDDAWLRQSVNTPAKWRCTI